MYSGNKTPNYERVLGTWQEASRIPIYASVVLDIMAMSPIAFLIERFTHQGGATEKLIAVHRSGQRHLPVPDPKL